MRQGPDYGMWVNVDDHGFAGLTVPLELCHEWAEYKTVNWHDNGDGTYTLTPSKDL